MPFKRKMKKSANRKLFSQAERDDIIQALCDDEDGIIQNEEKVSLHSWQKKYLVIPRKIGNITEHILVSQPEDGDLHDQMLHVACYEELFEILYKHHIPDHVKSQSLYNILSEKYSNIPRQICIDFCQLCPLCIEKIQNFGSPFQDTHQLSPTDLGRDFKLI